MTKRTNYTTLLYYIYIRLVQIWLAQPYIVLGSPKQNYEHQISRKKCAIVQEIRTTYFFPSLLKPRGKKYFLAGLLFTTARWYSTDCINHLRLLFCFVFFLGFLRVLLLSIKRYLWIEKKDTLIVHNLRWISLWTPFKSFRCLHTHLAVLLNLIIN